MQAEQHNTQKQTSANKQQRSQYRETGAVTEVDGEREESINF